MNATATIWTDEAVADYAARDGYRLETPAERAKWIEFYQELDYLISK